MEMMHKEVRKKVVEARKNGITVKEICRVNSLGKSAVYDLLKQERETGNMEPQTHMRGRKSTIGAECLSAIDEQIKMQCDITAREIKENLGLELCESQICRIIRHKLGYRYKKRRYMPVSESVRM